MSVETNTPVDSAERRGPGRAHRWMRARQVVLVIVTAHLGYVCIRNSYAALRDQGASVWALSLMWCVLAASSWALTIALLRSWRSHKTVGQVTAADEQPAPPAAAEHSSE